MDSTPFKPFIIFISQCDMSRRISFIIKTTMFLPASEFGVDSIQGSISHVFAQGLITTQARRMFSFFKIKHYTPEQRYWLKRRGQAGDNCWLLLQVGRSYWLFDWEGAQVINTLPYVETTRFAVRGWENGVVWDTLAEVLRGY